MDSLMSGAVDLILNNAKSKEPKSQTPIQPEPATARPVPTEALTEVERRVKARLGELRTEDLAELRAKAEELEAELKAEKEIAEAGNFDLRAELAAGTARETLAAKRAAAEIATEAVYIKTEQIDEIDAQIEKVSQRCLSRDTKVRTISDQIRKSYMTYLQAYAGGDRSFYKMNPDRPVAAMRLLLSGEQQLRDALKDDQLVSDLMQALTTFETPSSYQSLLWSFLSDRDRKEHFNNQLPNFSKEQ